MQRAVVPIVAVVFLAAGCDSLLGIQHVDLGTDAPPPTTMLVQQQIASDADAASVTATLGRRPTSGNVLIAVGASDRFLLATPVGGGVVSWTLATGSNSYANVELWYGVTDGTDAAVTVSCLCGDTGNMRLWVGEWAGLATDNLLEAAVSMDGSSRPGSATVPALTTVDSDDLLIFAVSVFGSITSEASGGGTWTRLDSVPVSPAVQSEWYQLVKARGSYTPTAGVNGDWDALLVAFRTKR